jgi:SepF-like predicted cell division protein (DUF552 family)
MFFMCIASYAQVKENISSINQQNQMREAELIVMKDVSEVVNSPDSNRDVYKELKFTLVDFPEEATYIVNGKPLTDPESIKYMLSTEKRNIKDIFISKPDELGKRTIKIKYERP